MCQIDLLNDQIQIRVITNERERETERKKRREPADARRVRPRASLGSLDGLFGRRSGERKTRTKGFVSYRYVIEKKKCIAFFPFFSLSVFRVSKANFPLRFSNVGMMRTLVARGRRRRRRRRRQRSDDDDDDALRRRRRLGRPRRDIEKKWPPTTPSRSSGRK